MDRDGMEMHVKAGGQWVSLDAYKARKKANETLDDVLIILVCIAALVWFIGRA